MPPQKKNKKINQMWEIPYPVTQKSEPLNHPPSPPCSANHTAHLLCSSKGQLQLSLSLSLKISSNSKFGCIGDGSIAMGLCGEGKASEVGFERSF